MTRSFTSLNTHCNAINIFSTNPRSTHCYNFSLYCTARFHLHFVPDRIKVRKNSGSRPRKSRGDKRVKRANCAREMRLGADVIKCERSAYVTLMLIRTFESLNAVAFFGAGAPKFHCTTAQVRTQPKYHTVKALNQQLSFDFCQPVYPFEASLTYIGRF